MGATMGKGVPRDPFSGIEVPSVEAQLAALRARVDKLEDQAQYHDHRDQPIVFSTQGEGSAALEHLRRVELDGTIVSPVLSRCWVSNRPSEVNHFH